MATGTQFEEMMKEGWFPFIEIIGGEYRSLSAIYQNKFHFEERINKIIEGFDGTLQLLTSSPLGSGAAFRAELPIRELMNLTT